MIFCPYFDSIGNRSSAVNVENILINKKIVNLNDFRKHCLRTESTHLCRMTLDRTIYMYNNEMYPEPILLRLIKNAAGLLEKKLKIDEIINNPQLSKTMLKELNGYEDEISQLTNEMNNILNKLAEYKTP